VYSISLELVCTTKTKTTNNFKKPKLNQIDCCFINQCSSVRRKSHDSRRSHHSAALHLCKTVDRSRETRYPCTGSQYLYTIFCGLVWFWFWFWWCRPVQVKLNTRKIKNIYSHDQKQSGESVRERELEWETDKRKRLATEKAHTIFILDAIRCWTVP